MKTKMNKIHLLLLPLILIAISFSIFSCTGNEDNGNQAQNLTGLCVRQCVLETGDASICDTKCACTTATVSKELSDDEIAELIGLFSNKSEGLKTSEAGIKYKKAFSDCNSGVK